MALSNLDKDNLNRLFTMLAVNNENDNKMEIIKKNYSLFGQLKLIAEQINNLEQKAQEIIYSAQLNENLHNIEMNCKKVCGNYYYHYIDNEGIESLSIISPSEWTREDKKFLGKYLFNYDNLFYFIE